MRVKLNYKLATRMKASLSDIPQVILITQASSYHLTHISSHRP